MDGDLRLALRSLLRRPGMSVAASLTLALGIGANTAIFSVVHAVLISPLPYPDAERLVGVWHTAPGIGADQVVQTHVSYRFYSQHNSVLDGLGIYIDGSVSLTGGDRPQELPATWLTPSVLEVLGVPPAFGRRFSDEEESPEAEPTVIPGPSDASGAERGLAAGGICVAIGLGGALAAARLLRAFLFEVSPTDPLTLVAVSVLLVAIAAVACLVPARRAASLDPLVALRHE